MTDSDLMRAALEYAARGWSVFPCQPRGKTPITPNGFKDASSDPAQVREYWTRYPRANIGIVTGKASGIFVVDIDVGEGKAGPESLAELERKNGTLPPTLRARTGSGGEHLFYRLPAGAAIRNTAGRLGAGIDTRGSGGYVVAAPSVHPSGALYAWTTAAPVADPPAWLVDMLDQGRRYAAAALEREAVNVRAAPNGTRNETLNRAAYSIGGLIAAGKIDEGTAESKLAAAAAAAGLEAEEIAGTIASGLKGGKAKPRTIPERPATMHGTNGRHRPEQADDTPDGMREVRINGRPMRDVSGDALAELQRANDPPQLFVRSGTLVSVVTDEHGLPRIEAVGESALRGRMCRAADFVRIAPSKEGELKRTDADPPLPIVRDILALGAWPFPALTGVIEAPALRPDGSIIARPGYDAATGLYHHRLQGLQVPAIPDHPTRDEIDAAIALLWEPLADFPFDTPASAANALALMLTPLYRPAIAGNVPLALIDAPQAGTGKSLLSRVVTALYAGNPDPSVITAPREDDEWRKRITSALMIGAPIVTIDNLTGTLWSGQLSAALTSGTWADRVLGGNDIARLPQRAVWIATGNNVRLGGDIPRRCFWIRLDARMSRPYQREGFKHSNIVAWVIDHRGELIAAALTLARAWFSAGCPSANTIRMGSFEDWARVLGGVLAVAGMPGFLGNLEEMLDSADEDGPQWGSFLVGLAEEVAGRAVSVSEICKAIESSAVLIELIPSHFDAPTKSAEGGAVVLTPKFKRDLGYQLRARKGTRYGDSQVRIERAQGAGGHEKVAKWRILFDTPQKSAGDAGNAGNVSVLTRETKTAQGTDTAVEMGRSDYPHHPHHPQGAIL